jgi:hypothetical protein
MNAFAHDERFAGHRWPAAWTAVACAALATALLPFEAHGGDWSGLAETPRSQLSTAAIEDAGAPFEMDHIPEADLQPQLQPDSIDYGSQADPGMPIRLPTEFESSALGMSECFVGDAPAAATTRCQRWTAQVDALLLWQTNIPSRPLYVDSATEQTVLNANQANPSVSAAPRYAILYHHDPCHAFEINYFQIQSFAGSAVVGPGENLYAVNDLPNVQAADIIAAQVNTTAGLKSWEFNLRRSQGGILTWIAGFRWVEWNQQMAIGDLNAFGATGVDGYLVQTGNNLYGGQFGGDLLLWNAYRKIKVNGLAKGGVYYNHQAYQNTTLFGDQEVAPPDSNTLAATRDTCSFVGEVGLTGEYKFAEWLSWRAGYTLFWLGGIATPANQLAVSDFTAQTTSNNTFSSAFLHGVTTGLEARW